MRKQAWWLAHIRKLTFGFSIFWMLLVVGWLTATIPPSPSRYIHLSRTFADTAGFFLYITLVIGPLAYHYRSSPWAAVAVKARRSIGVSVPLFSILHSAPAFLQQLGGVDGLQYLSTRYLVALGLGFVALMLLFVLTVTSPDRIVGKLGGRLWKAIHRLAYLIGVLVLFHMVLLGSRFANLHGLVAVSSYFAISLLWLLECNRLDAWLSSRLPILQQLRLALVLGTVVVGLVGMFMLSNPVNPYSLSGHDGHYEFENVVGTQGEHHE